jgi:tetratricopeptide (TPR) repeat protein
MGSTNQEAELCYRQGLQLRHSEKIEDAIDFFTKAIALDPNFIEAYQCRGDLLTISGHIVEGNTDLQKAKTLRSGKGKKQNTQKIKKYNLEEAESIYDHVFSEETDPGKGETVEFDNQIYDYVFSDDTMETEKLWDGLIDESSRETSSPAILEFADGRREEVFKALLFQPTSSEVTILQADTEGSKRIVLLTELNCIRLARLPANCEQLMDASCPIEIIETRDGNIYHECINPQQCLDGGLIGFSTKENTLFPYTFFPEANIKLRYQERYLGDILLEKRFITDDILKRALAEHQMLRNMQLGKIIARQANILHSAVEDAINRAQESGLQGLRTGEILLDAGLANEDQIMGALDFQEKMQRKKLGEFLVEKGIIREKELYISLAEKFRIPFIDLRQQKISKKILTLLPRELVMRYKVLPIALKDSTMVVATASPDISAVRDVILRNSSLKKVEFVLAQPTHLKNVVNILYQDRRDQET